MNWINKYVGIPYVEGGRDLSGVDCYGLLKLVYANEYHERLPDWLTDNITLSERSALIDKEVTSGAWHESEMPHDGDIVVCARKASYHLGLHYDGHVLHAVRGTGVVFQRLDDFMREHKRVTFGTWTPL